ncbi:hypothetical protein Kpol_1073p11 [Vanderwaltozyma polyspora DSM 70294]|uniref:Elongation factor 1-gamma 1 n=1 Tax=Vanderwaltozyma polyspora (strain ATCC 22028 / DSM 70294 / BCRC 21397 / CBS 2163 / NBRC 10782 / NRRL Y-8283 / UCD 57-17) TaxID=436907 RepID=A7TPS4_VANPO|nr:uncharacterized protein Kpol_1073p11 [Vanderwaltozyma polyspora DSM 70294]EDO15725.1 hypothetical protein Kpol_1073p11 [Vanderwaltozyma polyspora DSM 70294]
MSQGTLYTNPSPRTLIPKAIVEHFKLNVDVKFLQTADADFAAKFPLKKFPAFESAKGFKLTEAIAICYYLINLVDDEKVKATLLGANMNQEAAIMRWASLCFSDMMSNFAKAILPVTGVIPYNKKIADEGMAFIETVAAIFDARLKEYTYLATESISFADVVSAITWSFALTTVAGPETRAKYPHLMRWYSTVSASPIVLASGANLAPIDKAMVFTPPKKEKKQQEKPKKEEKPKAAAAEADAPAPAEKKPKHPLEALGRSTFVLDEWKRQYSNEDTRPVALPWFWEHYNPEEYSLWKVEYKYNDELTQTFMSNNLIGGFFNRLSASTKYMFGSMVVYGENNNNGIIGAVMVRGQDSVPAFDVAPDWESYSYTKLDPTNEEEKEFVNNMWAWDKPVVAGGVSKEIVDGKVLK